jgi:hypothetical protein
VDQGQVSDPDFISGTHQRENVQFADEYRITTVLKVKTNITTDCSVLKVKTNIISDCSVNAVLLILFVDTFKTNILVLLSVML